MTSVGPWLPIQVLIKTLEDGVDYAVYGAQPGEVEVITFDLPNLEYGYMDYEQEDWDALRVTYRGIKDQHQREMILACIEDYYELWKSYMEEFGE